MAPKFKIIEYPTLEFAIWLQTNFDGLMKLESNPDTKLTQPSSASAVGLCAVRVENKSIVKTRVAPTTDDSMYYRSDLKK